MYELFATIWAMFHWRLILSIVGSASVSLIMSNLFVGFTSGYCVSFIIVCTAFGIYWQARGEGEVGIAARIPGPKISWPVAFLGLSFVGLIWGGLVTELLKSALLAVILLILAIVLIGFWYGMVLHRPISIQKIVFSVGALLSGFLAVLIVVHFKA